MLHCAFVQPLVPAGVRPQSLTILAAHQLLLSSETELGIQRQHKITFLHLAFGGLSVFRKNVMSIGICFEEVFCVLPWSLMPWIGQGSNIRYFGGPPAPRLFEFLSVWLLFLFCWLPFNLLVSIPWVTMTAIIPPSLPLSLQVERLCLSQQCQPPSEGALQHNEVGSTTFDVPL